MNLVFNVSGIFQDIKVHNPSHTGGLLFIYDTNVIR